MTGEEGENPSLTVTINDELANLQMRGPRPRSSDMSQLVRLMVFAVVIASGAAGYIWMATRFENGALALVGATFVALPVLLSLRCQIERF